MISRWIHIAEALLELKNYNGLMSILTALHGSAISRLKLAWAEVPDKDKAIFENLTEQVSLLGHYKNYREQIRAVPPGTPCIPLIAVVCSDLNGLMEVLKPKTEEGLLNFDALSKFANSIWSIKKYMRCRYSLEVQKEIREYILSNTKDEFLWEGDKTLAAVADLRNDFPEGIPQSSDINPGPSGKSSFRGRSKTKSTSSMGNIGGELTDREWDILAGGLPAQKYNPGDVILPPNIQNKHLFRIKKGTVKVQKFIPGEGMRTVVRMREGSMFGEISVLLRGSEQGTTTATIVAEDEVECFKYKADFVLQMCQSKPIISQKLNKLLCIKLAQRLARIGSNEKEDDTLEVVKKKRKEKKKDDKDKNEETDSFHKAFRNLKKDSVIKQIQCEVKAGNKPTCSGILFITNLSLCFKGQVFGSKQKWHVRFSDISDIKPSPKRDKIIISSSTKGQIIIKKLSDIEPTELLLHNLYDQNKNQSKPEDLDETSESEQEEALKISDEDWSLILAGTKTESFNKNTHIIEQDKVRKPRLFQIKEGNCRIEKQLENGNTLILGNMSNNENDSIFGEISFFDTGRKSTASVLTDSDNTVIRKIEGYYLNILFEYFPHLPGRFFHYIAKILSNRLKLRQLEQGRDDDESKEKSKPDRKKRNQGSKRRNKGTRRREDGEDSDYKSDAQDEIESTDDVNSNKEVEGSEDKKGSRKKRNRRKKKESEIEITPSKIKKTEVKLGKVEEDDEVNNARDDDGDDDNTDKKSKEVKPKETEPEPKDITKEEPQPKDITKDEKSKEESEEPKEEVSPEKSEGDDGKSEEDDAKSGEGEKDSE